MEDPGNLAVDILVKTPFKTEELKGVALDWVITELKNEELVSVIWEMEDDDGYHYFRVIYNKKAKKHKIEWKSYVS